MQLDNKQQNKIKKLASFADNPQVETIKSFINIEDKLDSITVDYAHILSVVDELKTREFPQPIDHTAYMEEIMKIINESVEVSVKLNII